MSPSLEAFILWYQVGEQSPVVAGGSVVVGGAAREGGHQELLLDCPSPSLSCQPGRESRGPARVP